MLSGQNAKCLIMCHQGSTRRASVCRQNSLAKGTTELVKIFIHRSSSTYFFSNLVLVVINNFFDTSQVGG